MFPVVPDYSISTCQLYGFVDAAYVGDRDIRELTAQLIDGGVDVIQVRAKGKTTWQVIDIGIGVVEVARPRGVPVIVNDDIEAAIEVRADGIHLGQEDWQEAKTSKWGRFVRDFAIVGLSTHSVDQIVQAREERVDYIGVGPVFATGTKPSVKPVGLDLVRAAGAKTYLPWFAIGGITLERLPEVMAAGAQRVAVVSAILNAPDVTAAAAQFKMALTASLAKT